MWQSMGKSEGGKMARVEISSREETSMQMSLHKNTHCLVPISIFSTLYIVPPLLLLPVYNHQHCQPTHYSHITLLAFIVIVNPHHTPFLLLLLFSHNTHTHIPTIQVFLFFFPPQLPLCSSTPVPGVGFANGEGNSGIDKGGGKLWIWQTGMVANLEKFPSKVLSIIPGFPSPGGEKMGA